MITIRNKKPYDSDINTIRGRAAHLVQSLQDCPPEFILKTLTIFDKYNSPGTKSCSAKGWIREFSGFGSQAAGKKMEPIIEILSEELVVENLEKLNELMKDMPDVA